MELEELFAAAFPGNPHRAPEFYLPIFQQAHGRDAGEPLSGEDEEHLARLLRALPARTTKPDGSASIDLEDCRACQSLVALDEALPDPLTNGDRSHFESVRHHSATGDSIAVDGVRRGMFLLRSALQLGETRWQEAFPNNFGALLCFARVYRHIRAAVLLAHFGYYAEIGPLLRSAYEAAGLGRYIAHAPDRAEEWLKGTWIQDKEVRKWFGGSDSDYRQMYRTFSEAAHPMAVHALLLIEPSKDGYTLKLDSPFDSVMFDGAMAQILAFTLWTCFAMRNAAASEDLLPPDWREALATLATEVAPLADWSHIQKDWDAERAKWKRMIEQVRPSAELDEELRSNPLSWLNVRDSDNK